MNTECKKQWGRANLCKVEVINVLLPILLACGAVHVEQGLLTTLMQFVMITTQEDNPLQAVIAKG
eukprot:3190139-Amphidinium_carterae.1